MAELHNIQETYTNIFGPFVWQWGNERNLIITDIMIHFYREIWEKILYFRCIESGKISIKYIGYIVLLSRETFLFFILVREKSQITPSLIKRKKKKMLFKILFHFKVTKDYCLPFYNGFMFPFSVSFYLNR